MLDLNRLLLAIARVESGGGTNNYPRFEAGYAPPYFVGTIQGRTVRGTGTCWNSIVAERWKKWGMASACSFSSWQILAHTAMDMGFCDAPWALWDDRIAAHWVKRRVQRIIDKGADTVEKVADAWNSGNFHGWIV